MKFFTKKADLPADKAGRVPPGQYLTEKWPVLHYGPVPTFNPKTWDLRVFGKVKNELRWTWDEFLALDKEINTQVTADMHCVTTWSRLDQKWEGVSFAKIVELAQPTEEAKAARAQKIPLGRMCEPEDIADPILFLAGSAARMITGVALTVDGGVLVKNDTPYEEYFRRR